MKIKNCPRCGKACNAEKSGNQNARPLRKSDNGMCLECATTVVIMESPSAGMFTKDALLSPAIQSQFAAVLGAGNADPDAHGIDWNRLVENWELPFPRKFAPKPW